MYFKKRAAVWGLSVALGVTPGYSIGLILFPEKLYSALWCIVLISIFTTVVIFFIALIITQINKIMILLFQKIKTKEAVKEVLLKLSSWGNKDVEYKDIFPKFDYLTYYAWRNVIAQAKRKGIRKSLGGNG